MSTTQGEPPEEKERRLEEAIADYRRAVDSGLKTDRARSRILSQYPGLMQELNEHFDNEDRIIQVVGQLGPSPPQVGGTLGDCELLEEIGRGGMGVVYKARQINLNRIVALKTILAGSFASQEDVDRFKTEAKAAAELKHPNIVPIYEVGEDKGCHYFSMELIEGGSLDRQVPRLVDAPRSAARLMVTVARAVRHAHQRGILHRDLKPANILMDDHGQPHLTDFGLAKRVESESSRTATGTVVGSIPYMAPEQASGKTKQLTWATDVYGLGAVLYELLTGRPPFGGEALLETLLQVREKEPDPPRTHNRRVDSDLEAICLMALRKVPGDRYESAKALADDLECWLDGKPVKARPVGRATRAWRWCRRNPAVAGLTAATAALLVFAAVMFALRVADVREKAAREAGRREATLKGSVHTARIVADLMLNRMREWSVTVVETAESPEVRDLLEREDYAGLQEYLERIPPTSGIENWHVMNAKGIMVARTPHDKIVGLDFKERDYFRGTRGHVGKSGEASVHVSKVYRSVADRRHRFDICAPIVKPVAGAAPEFLGVIAVAVTTDPTMGLKHIHDERRKAVLVAPGDTDPRPGDTHPRLPEYLVLLHPEYPHGGEAIPFDKSVLPAFPPRGCENELSMPDFEGIPAEDGDYRDPVGDHPERDDRWLAGFAPVGNTGFVVIVQQKEE